MHPHLGTHILLECWEVSSKILDSKRQIEEALQEAAQVANVHVLQSFLHKFEPEGVTGFLLLAESHLSIHTWPEKGYAAIDIYTCGKENWPTKSVDKIIDLLMPGEWELWTVSRGNETRKMILSSTTEGIN